MSVSPLRVSRDRIVLYGVLIAAACLVQVRFVVAQGFGDWSAFWAAGATAGTRDLLDPARHAHWQHVHHLLTTIFPYLPGTAWLLVPIASLPLAAGYAVNFVVMLVATAVCALLAARVYGLSRLFAVTSAFAWAPLIAAPATGQNSPLGLLLAMAAIAAIAADSWLGCGIATGLLLYKLPYAIPFIALLAVRRNGRALGVVAVCAVLWYFASAAATAWDWQWPMHYAAALSAYAGPDAQFNAVKAIGIPQLLLRAGVPQVAAMLTGAALFALLLPVLARSSALAAASLAPLLGLALGPHTLPYDLALALPAIWYMARYLGEPLRTRLVAAAYVLAPLWLLSAVLRFDALALICEGMLVIWLIKQLDEPAPEHHLRLADSGNRSQA